MNRLKEFFIVSKYRWIEFFSYTICGIDFYRNYSRFYWKNKATKRVDEQKPISSLTWEEAFKNR
jgi:hypothetical protein